MVSRGGAGRGEPQDGERSSAGSRELAIAVRRLKNAAISASGSRRKKQALAHAHLPEVAAALSLAAAGQQQRQRQQQPQQPQQPQQQQQQHQQQQQRADEDELAVQASAALASLASGTDAGSRASAAAVAPLVALLSSALPTQPPDAARVRDGAARALAAVFGDASPGAAPVEPLAAPETARVLAALLLRRRRPLPSAAALLAAARAVAAAARSASAAADAATSLALIDAAAPEPDGGGGRSKVEEEGQEEEAGRAGDDGPDVAAPAGRRATRALIAAGAHLGLLSLAAEAARGRWPHRGTEAAAAVFEALAEIASGPWAWSVAARVLRVPPPDGGEREEGAQEEAEEAEEAEEQDEEDDEGEEGERAFRKQRRRVAAAWWHGGPAPPPPSPAPVPLHRLPVLAEAAAMSLRARRAPPRAAFAGAALVARLRGGGTGGAGLPPFDEPACRGALLAAALAAIPGVVRLLEDEEPRLAALAVRLGSPSGRRSGGGGGGGGRGGGGSGGGGSAGGGSGGGAAAAAAGAAAAAAGSGAGRAPPQEAAAATSGLLPLHMAAALPDVLARLIQPYECASGGGGAGPAAGEPPCRDWAAATAARAQLARAALDARAAGPLQRLLVLTCRTSPDYSPRTAPPVTALDSGKPVFSDFEEEEEEGQQQHGDGSRAASLAASAADADAAAEAALLRRLRCGCLEALAALCAAAPAAARSLVPDSPYAGVYPAVSSALLAGGRLCWAPAAACMLAALRGGGRCYDGRGRPVRISVQLPERFVDVSAIVRVSALFELDARVGVLREARWRLSLSREAAAAEAAAAAADDDEHMGEEEEGAARRPLPAAALVAVARRSQGRAVLDLARGPPLPPPSATEAKEACALATALELLADSMLLASPRERARSILLQGGPKPSLAFGLVAVTGISAYVDIALHLAGVATTGDSVAAGVPRTATASRPPQPQGATGRSGGGAEAELPLTREALPADIWATRDAILRLGVAALRVLRNLARGLPPPAVRAALVALPWAQLRGLLLPTAVPASARQAPRAAELRAEALALLRNLSAPLPLLERDELDCTLEDLFDVAAEEEEEEEEKREEREPEREEGEKGAEARPEPAAAAATAAAAAAAAAVPDRRPPTAKEEGAADRARMVKTWSPAGAMLSWSGGELPAALALGARDALASLGLGDGAATAAAGLPGGAGGHFVAVVGAGAFPGEGPDAFWDMAAHAFAAAASLLRSPLGAWRGGGGGGQGAARAARARAAAELVPQAARAVRRAALVLERDEDPPEVVLDCAEQAMRVLAVAKSGGGWAEVLVGPRGEEDRAAPARVRRDLCLMRSFGDAADEATLAAMRLVRLHLVLSDRIRAPSLPGP